MYLLDPVGLDRRRWRRAELGYMDEPLDAVPPEQIQSSSKGLPWHGLSLWHQQSDAQDLYIPAAGKHCIIVRRGPSTGLVQRHGHETQLGRWNRGEVVILPAQTPSFWRTELPRDNIHLDLSPLWLQRVHGDGEKHISLRSCFGARDPVLVQLVQVLFSSLDDNSSLHAAFANGIASSVAMHLLEHYCAHPSQSERVPPLSARQLRRIADLVDSHLNQALPLVALAAEVELSVYHFARCFKAASGLTPHQFVLGRKMARARALLLETKRPVLEIAQSVGFASASHFSQAFQKHWGVSPSVLRRSA